MIRHVLGMAKSNFDFNGAKTQKLELDYLRLVYCVKELRRNTDEAQGHLLVMNESIVRRVVRWQEKYNAGDAVIVHVARVEPDELEELTVEKLGNVQGMIAGATFGEVGDQSDASTGHAFGELQLEHSIARLENGVVRCLNESEFPFRIRWDYFGRIETATQ